MSSKDKFDNTQTVFLFGILMGLADAIPGVSGGTIAFLLGFYKKLIDSLSFIVNFFRNSILLKTETKKNSLAYHLRFLIPLGVGILISYYFVTLFLVGPSDNPGLLRKSSTAPMLYGLFFGLVFASLPRLWNEIKNPNNGKILTAFSSALLTYFILGLDFFSGESTPHILFISGILSLTAMLLPGLSGAMVLVILGQYSYIAISFHNGSFMALIPFFLGGFFGLFTIIPFLRYSMGNHYSETMAVMTGMLAGSLRTLWPLKSNYDIYQGPLINISFGSSWNDFEISVELLLLVLFFVLLGILIEKFILQSDTSSLFRK